MSRWLNEKLRKKRDKLIVELYERGLTIPQIAPQVRQSGSGVWKILKNAGVKPRSERR